MSRKVLEYEEKDAKAKDPFKDDFDPEQRGKNGPRKLYDEITGRPLNVNQVKIRFPILLKISKLILFLIILRPILSSTTMTINKTILKSL